MDREQNPRLRVVVSNLAVYSIWPADRPLPIGWHDAGRVGTREQCLDYIRAVAQVTEALRRQSA